MANEFICWDCKGDGTRCDCHKKRPYHYVKSLGEQMQEAQDKADRAFAELKSFVRLNSRPLNE